MYIYIYTLQNNYTIIQAAAHTTYCDFYMRGQQTKAKNGCGSLLTNNHNCCTPCRTNKRIITSEVLQHEALTSIRGSILNTRDPITDNPPHRTPFIFSYMELLKLSSHVETPSKRLQNRTHIIHKTTAHEPSTPPIPQCHHTLF